MESVLSGINLEEREKFEAGLERADLELRGHLELVRKNADGSVSALVEGGEAGGFGAVGGVGDLGLGGFEYHEMTEIYGANDSGMAASPTPAGAHYAGV